MKKVITILILLFILFLALFTAVKTNGIDIQKLKTGIFAQAQETDGEPADETQPEGMAFPNLSRDVSLSQSLKSSNVTVAWGFVLDFVNIIAIFAFLAIAFANILRIDVETYNIKRMLPALIIGLILANLSHLICRAMVDFAAMLMNYFIPQEIAGQFVYDLYEGMYGGFFNLTAAIGTISAVGIVGLFFGGPIGCGVLAIAVILLTFPALIMIALWFLLILRTFIVWLLVILSPIVFFAMFLPPAQKVVGQWWGQFLRWVFMGPIAYFILALARQFSLAMPAGTATQPSGDNPPDVGGITRFLFTNALLCFAIFVPWFLGGPAMKLWAKAGQWLGLSGAKAASGGATALTHAGGARLTAWGKRKGGKLGGIAQYVGTRMERQVAPHLLPSVYRELSEARQKAAVSTQVRGARKEITEHPLLRGLFNDWVDNEANGIDRSKDNIWQRALYNEEFAGAAPQILAAGLRDVGKRGPQNVEERRALGSILHLANKKAGVDVVGLAHEEALKENELRTAVSAGAPLGRIRRLQGELRGIRKNNQGKMITFGDFYDGISGSAENSRKNLKRKGFDADEIMESVNGTLRDEDARRAIERGDWAHFRDAKYRDTLLSSLASGPERILEEQTSELPTRRVTT